MEGIQEFALSTQRFSAANGRSGGALLSVVSKSGTNSFHGSLFGFFRHDKLNANAPALLAEASGESPRPARQKPPFNRQQFGGSIGGPIKRTRRSSSARSSARASAATPSCPSVIQAQIAFLEPLRLQAVPFLPQPFNDWQYTIKGDFNLSPNHTLVTRFAGQNNDALNDQAGFLIVHTDLSGGNESLNTLYNFLASWTCDGQSEHRQPVHLPVLRPSTTASTRRPTWTCSSSRTACAIGRNGNVPQQTLQKKHQFRDDLTWNRGNHGFKFGGDFTYVPTLGGLFAFNSAPEYDF